MLNTISNTLRSINYKRLASRSTKQANRAMDKASQYKLIDPLHFKFREEFFQHWTIRNERLSKSSTARGRTLQ